MTAIAMEHHPPIKPVAFPFVETLVLGVASSAPGHARAFVAEHLNKWHMSPLIDDTVLVTSEIVTNAVNASILQSGGALTIWLWGDGRQALIEVWDEAPGLPTPVAAPGGEGGRGLHIVARLSVSWGYYPDRSGKVVWAYLSLMRTVR